MSGEGVHGEKTLMPNPLPASVSHLQTFAQTAPRDHARCRNRDRDTERDRR
jgi:hypothetical protein